jgi:hypothetical protein
MIEGGYYMKARCIKDSEIAHAPSHIREIWDWLIREANHKDVKVHGRIIKRGQCVRSYKDIQEGLHWKIGWRKKTYSKDQCETAMKFFKKTKMMTSEKTTRGMIITICNYDYYQNSRNYENRTRNHEKTITKPQCIDTINKTKQKEKRNNKNKTYDSIFAETVRKDAESKKKWK